MEEEITRKIPLTVAIASIIGVVGVAAFAFFLLLTGGDEAAQPSPALPTIASAAAVPTVVVEEVVMVEKTAVSTQLPPTSTPALATHTVQAGETMYGIALLYGMEPDDLIALNHITNPDTLDIGQVLQVNGLHLADAPVDSAEAAQPADTIIPEAPTSINGVPIAELVSIDAAALQTIRTIFAHGQAMGRNPHAFSKAGDSTIEIPHFLARFDSEPYNLADFAYLQPTIAYYQGSFARDSAAVRIGMHSWTMLDPAWADKSVCFPNETAVSCEIRLHNPSIMLVRLGANDDAGEAYFDEQMRLTIDAIIAEGVIPIIGTKADRAEGSNINNGIIRQIVADYHLPVWDFDRLADTLPARGLDVDYTHMTTFYAHDYADPTAFTRGHAMHNLTALIVLDEIRRNVASGE